MAWFDKYRLHFGKSGSTSFPDVDRRFEDIERWANSRFMARVRGSGAMNFAVGANNMVFTGDDLKGLGSYVVPAEGLGKWLVTANGNCAPAIPAGSYVDVRVKVNSAITLYAVTENQSGFHFFDCAKIITLQPGDRVSVQVNRSGGAGVSDLAIVVELFFLG